MPANRRASIVVLYNRPSDEREFERYYAETHGPLLGKSSPAIGIVQAELTKFGPGPDGSSPPFHRKADLWFDSEEARRKGMATDAFRALAGDLANFATGGVTIMLGEQTN
ncbi:MAG TPA: EthD family reductase [Gemmatimonadaceae bacterium]|nr:EthD family reductase [Gemmatimonadaceae bacterium]